MSYEGYSQFWCKKGHYWTKDCYELPNLMYEESKKQKCPICDGEEVFENMVNVTNGSFDDDGTRIDGFIQPKEKQKISGICSCCGKEHVCSITYYIPKLKKSNSGKSKKVEKIGGLKS